MYYQINEFKKPFLMSGGSSPKISPFFLIINQINQSIKKENQLKQIKNTWLSNPNLRPKLHPTTK